MLTEEKPHIVHVSEVLATGILEFIYALVTEVKDYRHTIIYRVRDLWLDDESIRDLFPSHVVLCKWHNVDRAISLTKDSKAAIELYKLLKANKPDLLHLHSSKAGALGRIVAPLVLNKKAVIYTPNGAPFARTDISNNKKLLYRYSEKIANRLSGQVICVSKSESNAYAQVGISSTYINNGVALHKDNLAFNNDTSHKKKFRIVTSGRIAGQKNPASFNRIAEKFIANDMVEFVWVGDGKQKRKLNSPNITITGWVDKEKVYEHLQNASLYISTALWEGLPFSVLEAMSIGIPLVISNCIGNIDLIEHGESGFVYNDEKQCIYFINQFLEHPELINKVGKASWQRCRALFSKTQMALNYKSLYDQVSEIE